MVVTTGTHTVHGIIHKKYARVSLKVFWLKHKSVSDHPLCYILGLLLVFTFSVSLVII